MPNGRNAGRLFADCTNLYGYGEWHKLRPLPRQRLRKLLRMHTVECVHCHRRFKDGELFTEAGLARKFKQRSREAGRRLEDRRGPPRLPR